MSGCCVRSRSLFFWDAFLLVFFGLLTSFPWLRSSNGSVIASVPLCLPDPLHPSRCRCAFSSMALQNTCEQNSHVFSDCFFKWCRSVSRCVNLNWDSLHCVKKGSNLCEAKLVFELAFFGTNSISLIIILKLTLFSLNRKNLSWSVVYLLYGFFDSIEFTWHVRKVVSIKHE